MKLAPKNWTEFQHYKDRNPPWIRLHRRLLDDRDFQRLPIASKALAPMLWLLASEAKDGVFEGSVEELAFRLRCREKDVEDGLKPLIDKGFFVPVHDASSVLADSEQVAPESCSETETETEQRQKGAVALLLAKGIPEDLARDFQAIRKAAKAPLTETALAGIEREASAAGYSLEKALRECCSRGWRGFKAEWVNRRAEDRASITVPSSKQPDPELEKIKAHKGAPIPPEIAARMAALKGKVH